MVLVLVYVDDLLISGNCPQLILQTRSDLQLKFNMKDLDTENDNLLTDASQHQRLIGRLLYLTMTRVDIAFAVQVLSQIMHKPKQSHLEVVLRVVRYIKSTLGLGLLMTSEGSGKLEAFFYSDWEGCLQSRKYVTGYLVKLGSALIS
ncbi:putative mitochondrial protein AtMg00240 [Nicotiana tabacum]|uniref:Mitochondrial protein AtMg00240 n=1 Tax=Nicotiana tabacum TaxID=4097 RepID=A0AC58SIU2_TOBAC